jgi:hypothetical protein
MNRRSVTAWTVFRARVAELGGTVLEPEWLGTHSPHRVQCGHGHGCSPRPLGVLQGQGICRVCARKDPATAQSAFRARVGELGGTVLEATWLGKDVPRLVCCAAGHECRPRPGNVIRGQGICRICADAESSAVWAAFRSRVAELGGTVLESKWLGNNTPHRVRCGEGHVCKKRPLNIQSGQGICRHCAGKVWDVVYVVADTDADRGKFGITSGDPRVRLGEHRRYGYTEVVRIVKIESAQDAERAILAALAAASHRPVRGREHFALTALDVICTVVDAYAEGSTKIPLPRSP